MKVAVITPYHTEPLEMLKRAHDSVMAQTHDCIHYMVADGHPRSEIDPWNVRHIVLPVEHSNNGNTPRAIGSIDAIGDGFDAISYLDADNWFEPDHIAGLIALQEETKADLVSSGRVIHALDGTVLLEEGETEDGEKHADTSALLVFENAFQVIPMWALMPDELGPNCDRVFVHFALKLGLIHRHSAQLTMHFTSRYGPHYRAANMPVPDQANGMGGMKVSSDFMRRMAAMGCKDVMSRTAIAAALKSKQAQPITVITLADETTLAPDDKAIIDGLEAQLGSNVEFYFTTADELASESEITAPRLSVFVLIFESIVDEWQSIERFIEKRPDLRLIYIRAQRVDPGADIETTLDSRAMSIVVDNESLREAYHQRNRFGAGHVFVADGRTSVVNALTLAIKNAVD